MYHHQFQKYLFRDSESLKNETRSQRDTTNRLAIGRPPRIHYHSATLNLLAGGLLTIEGDSNNAIVLNDVTGTEQDLFPEL